MIKYRRANVCGGSGGGGGGDSGGTQNALH